MRLGKPRLLLVGLGLLALLVVSVAGVTVGLMTGGELAAFARGYTLAATIFAVLVALLATFNN